MNEVTRERVPARKCIDAKFHNGSRSIVILFGTFDTRTGTKAAWKGGIVTFVTALASPRLKLYSGDLEQNEIRGQPSPLVSAFDE